MIYKTYTKKFIANFNFPNPTWDNLPLGFPSLSKKGLTKEESHLLDAIVLAWLTTVPEGRNTLYRKVKFIGLICLIGLISLISLLFNKGQFSKPVSAATLKVSGVIESTMSAILRK